MRGSGGERSLLILKGLVEGPNAVGSPRIGWVDNIIEWTELQNYLNVRRAAADRERYRRLSANPRINEDGTRK